MYQCSVPSNASNIGDLTFNIHFDHTEVHSQQSFNLNLTSIGRYNITGEDEIFDENFEIEIHKNYILLSRFRVQRTWDRANQSIQILDPCKVFSKMAILL